MFDAKFMSNLLDYVYKNENIDGFVFLKDRCGFFGQLIHVLKFDCACIYSCRFMMVIVFGSCLGSEY